MRAVTAIFHYGRHPRRPRRCRRSLIFPLFLLASACAAAPAWAAIPEPPHRPSHFTQPPAEENAQPQRQNAAPTYEREPVDVDISKLHFFYLPQASRTKMHQCGEKWRKMKMDGQARGKTWRTFAEKCLVQ